MLGIPVARLSSESDGMEINTPSRLGQERGWIILWLAGDGQAGHTGETLAHLGKVVMADTRTGIGQLYRSASVNPADFMSLL
jgi:hypothetical protein